MSLIWMFGRNWERVLNVECELLFNNLKRFPSHFTLHNTIEASINIPGSYIKPYNSFIILRYGKRMIYTSFKFLIFFCMPIPSLCFHFFFGHWKVLLCDCFIVPKWRKMMGEKFSPFSSTSHMIDNLSTEGFIFLGGVGFV